MTTPLIIALPKGRILKEALPLLARIGIVPEADFTGENSRKLTFATSRDDVRVIRVRSFDVATFVAFGAAQLGIAGNDVLMEFDFSEIYAPVDLGIGHCRLSVAQPAALDPDLLRLSHVRVATKYPGLTRRHFAARGLQAEVIKLNGAMELAPLVGLSSRIVDLVSTGKTLAENGLVEVEVIANITSRLIANRAAFKTDSRVVAIIDAMRELTEKSDAATA
ncbi:ATP phosphoribosyltransferase [Sandarakinorhabdus limnophila]|uniref:ATP phosphoribosyltransferase n=1 Tax=Sandarakinorhabdus limnophila TaxID=210512 RepID=UPI0026E95AD4|nr:ATP phosphoribosyltransferase [Sandarakinorhabdus limnophila]